MSRLELKAKSAQRRKQKVRAVIKKSGRLRLSVFISNRHIEAQLIDDKAHTTLAYVSSNNSSIKGTMTEKAEFVGKEIAKKAKEKKIKEVALDRGPKQYHGRLKVLAETARKEGLVI